jgi:hypothetical protein
MSSTNNSGSLVYASPNGVDISLDYTIPADATAENPAPVLIWFHGGGLIQVRLLLISSLKEPGLDERWSEREKKRAMANVACFPDSLHVGKSQRYLLLIKPASPNSPPSSLIPSYLGAVLD